MFWWIVAYIALMVISYALMPKPEAEPPASIEDFGVPTAEEGRSIPVVFGTRTIASPNIVWYGHLKTKAIEKDAK
jgi:hypothetical protein